MISVTKKVLIFSLFTLMAFLPFFALADTQNEKPTIATEATLKTVDPIHEAIKKQLKAFRDKDARAAFSMASPAVQDKYGDAKKFYRMMKIINKPLTDHVSYVFTDRSEMGGAHLQKVELLSPQGTPVIVIFKLIQSEQIWSVESITILDTDGQPT